MSSQFQNDLAVTIVTLRKMKEEGAKFVCLTAYDMSFARVIDEAGVDVVLVGDSLGMVIQGHTTTLPVTMDQMVYHSACVAKGLRRALLMVDMPFMSHISLDMAVANAGRLMKEGFAAMVKLEGCAVQVEMVRRLTDFGIPVCAHLGLQPQSVHKLGGYRIQGRGDDAAKQMKDDANHLQEAGADILLLECVPAPLAEEITQALKIPVIGIGAGKQCDGQVLVLQDILGITPQHTPKFAKNFLEGAGSIQQAITNYARAVRDGSFPADEQSFS